ncbi:MAG: phosphate ABC transporter substrate-binding/OmpA family protein [Pseudomonadota bacterium]
MVISTSALQKSAIGAAMLLGATVIPHNVLAQEITLESLDGKVNLIGQLVEFSDGTYKIKTSFGDFEFAADTVTCTGAACPDLTVDAPAAQFSFAGSDTVGLGIMPLLISGYATSLDADAEITDTENANEIVASIVNDGGFGDEMAQVLVSSTSSGTAFRALANRSADIGMSSRRIKPEEARQLQASGAGNMLSPSQEHIVAVDSLAIITHPSNPVKAISMDQLRDIYSGRISNWRQLGGEDRAIEVMTRQTSSGTRSVFESRLFQNRSAKLRSDMTIAEDNRAMASQVTDNEGAIGFVGSGYTRGAQQMKLISECGIATSPNAFSAKTEEYPFQRRLYLYNRANGLDENAEDFIDYVTSVAADGVIAKAGFIDLSIVSQKQALDGSRARSLLEPSKNAAESSIMRDMLSMMLQNERLSTTFRFVTGSAILDERGEGDIERLLEYLGTMPAGTKVTFVGFTDSVGTFTKNYGLSVGRAQQVRNAVLAKAGDRLAGLQINHTGFGEVAPAACNTSDFGRSVNRRVEVWIESTGSS